MASEVLTDKSAKAAAPTKILTISTGGIFLSSLRYIEKQLEPFRKTGDITTKIVGCSGRNNLTIVFHDLQGGVTVHDGLKRPETARKIASTLVNAMANVVITDCKHHYIETSLKLPIDDEISRHAFIRALSGFDRCQDLAIAKSLIKLTPDFLLDSFYTFSLDTLKTRWQEVCALANENACYLVCDGTFRELLRFLIRNLETTQPEVHLFECDGNVEIRDQQLRPINVYVNDELSPDAKVVSQLISVAPKRIFLHQNISASPILEFIQNLFGNCVQVVQN
jgi:hypothetical protein